MFLVCTRTARAVGIARVGHDDQKIVYGTLEELLSIDFGAPLHCLVLVGKTHFMEDEVLDFYKTSREDL
jgi:diphthine synthase